MVVFVIGKTFLTIVLNGQNVNLKLISGTRDEKY